MLIYYPTYYLVPIVLIISFDEHEYKFRCNMKRNVLYNRYRNMNKDNFEEIGVRQQRFTLEELSKYNGINGNAAYVSVNGIVYDVSSVQAWAGGVHFGVSAGSNVTENFITCHGASKMLEYLPKVGVVTG